LLLAWEGVSAVQLMAVKKQKEREEGVRVSTFLSGAWSSDLTSTAEAFQSQWGVLVV
jgi:hypothetical protein